MASPTDPLSDALDDDRWEESKVIFNDALERPRSDRRQYVLDRCGKDDQLAAFVLDLLSDTGTREDSDLEDDGFLEPPDPTGWTDPTDSGSTPSSKASSDGAVRTPYGAGEVVGRRYRLDSILGRGAGGEVFAATDLLFERDVAVKILEGLSREGLDLVRREIAALRILRLPGVVQLVDEGTDRGRPYIVMEVAPGEPFPGSAIQLSAEENSSRHRWRWNEIERPLIGLLDTLDRVHASGFLHRDLKPSNVVVSAEGWVTVLDLGLAWRAVSDLEAAGPDSRVGTPAYMAPERQRGEAASVASDLYSVGFMSIEALTGRRPTSDSEARRKLANLDLPGPARAVLESLLAADPLDRPTSGHVATQQLTAGSREPWIGGDLDALLPCSEPPNAPLSREALLPMFEGPDLLFHLREDAVKELLSRTSGNREAIREELARWFRAGLAYPSEGGGSTWTVPRSSLDRLARLRRLESSSATNEPTLLQLIRSGRAEEVPAAACRSASRLRERGEPGLAMAELIEGLRAARNLQAEQIELVVLEDMAITAYLSMRIPDFQRAIHELELSPARDQARAHLEDFLRASIRLVQGDNRERSSDSIEKVPPFDRLDLELARQTARVFCARKEGDSREQRIVEEVARWSEGVHDPDVHAALAGFRGWIDYARGDYLRAADQHAQAAELRTDRLHRTTSILNSASAAMEAQEVETAAARAQEGLSMAIEIRNPLLEARARWLCRTCAYRLERPLEVDHDLLIATKTLNAAAVQAWIFVNEASIAWRQGDFELGRSVAREGRMVSRASSPIVELLMRGLAFACGDAIEDGELTDMLTRAETLPPSLGLQVLGLVMASGHTPADVCQKVETLASRIPESHRSGRREVLSVEEVVQLARS